MGKKLETPNDQKLKGNKMQLCREPAERSCAHSNNWVCRLNKGIYGLKQGGRLWYQKLDSVLQDIGFSRIRSDQSIYVWVREDVKVIVPVFVDDLTLASKSKVAIQHVKAELAKRFKLRDLGPTSFLLGVEITRDRATCTLQLSQRQYALDILERFNFGDCGTVSTPMDPGAKLSVSQAPTTADEIAHMRNVPYINAVGALMYLSVATRPDIAYAVGVLCRFNSNPGIEHWKAVKHLFRYVKSTVDYKLTYAPSPSKELFTSYTDSDHGGNVDTGRSTSGYVVKMGTGAVSWRSKLQSIVALSTTEAEYVAAVSAGAEVVWMRALMAELGYDTAAPSTLHMDNKSAIQVAKNPEHHGRMKHLDLRFFWLRDQVEKKVISVAYIPTDTMPADILTKPLGRVKVDACRQLLGLEG